jgi:hypothetical protein
MIGLLGTRSEPEAATDVLPERIGLDRINADKFDLVHEPQQNPCQGLRWIHTPLCAINYQGSETGELAGFDPKADI